MQVLFPLYDYDKLAKKLQLLKQQARNEIKRENRLQQKKLREKCHLKKYNNK